MWKTETDWGSSARGPTALTMKRWSGAASLGIGGLAILALCVGILSLRDNVRLRSDLEDLVAATHKMAVELRDAERLHEQRLTSHDTTIGDLDRRISYAEAVADRPIDLTASELQPCDEGFSVGQLEVAAVPAGAKVSGLIVNSQAVRHSSVRFVLKVAGQEATFTTMNLPAGGSSRFSVVIPDVKAGQARFATLHASGSTIQYFRPR